MARLVKCLLSKHGNFLSSIYIKTSGPGESTCSPIGREEAETGGCLQFPG